MQRPHASDMASAYGSTIERIGSTISVSEQNAPAVETIAEKTPLGVRFDVRFDVQFGVPLVARFDVQIWTPLGAPFVARLDARFALRPFALRLCLANANTHKAKQAKKAPEYWKIWNHMLSAALDARCIP